MLAAFIFAPIGAHSEAGDPNDSRGIAYNRNIVPFLYGDLFVVEKLLYLSSYTAVKIRITILATAYE
jgi:hypothetical protein